MHKHDKHIQLIQITPWCLLFPFFTLSSKREFCLDMPDTTQSFLSRTPNYPAFQQDSALVPKWSPRGFLYYPIMDYTRQVSHVPIQNPIKWRVKSFLHYPSSTGHTGAHFIPPFPSLTLLHLSTLVTLGVLKVPVARTLISSKALEIPLQSHDLM